MKTERETIMMNTRCLSCGYEAITHHPKDEVLPCRKCKGKLEIIAQELKK